MTISDHGPVRREPYRHRGARWSGGNGARIMDDDQLVKIVLAAMDLGSDDLPSWEPAKATLRELLPETVYREVMDDWWERDQ